MVYNANVYHLWFIDSMMQYLMMQLLEHINSIVIQKIINIAGQ